ncbi:MAG: hypothetical protein QXM82_02705 [Ignisphaera sp.]
MLCREYNLQSIHDHNTLCRILCYPRCDSTCFNRRIEDIERSGIDAVYSFGKIAISRGVYIVGKGHSSIVALAHHSLYGVVALKIRRTDSKRFSLVWEAEMLSKASATGFVPKVYMATEDVLVREYIDGPTLAEFFMNIKNNREILLKAIESLLKASYHMDKIGIDLVEISRPFNQVVYLCENPSKPFFIDLESAKISLQPSNVTKVLGFIINGTINGTKIREIIGIEPDKVGILMNLAKSYKADSIWKKNIVDELVKIIIG